jgi:flagella basal body P-ring formation protein FlgA
VKLVYATRGLRLTVDGLAQNDAAKGESVRVLNVYSKRAIEAVAYADGEARVMQR